MNHLLSQRLIEECIRQGIVEFCVAPGSRNAPLVYALNCSRQVKVHYWSEERSAAFFALGRIKATGKPVAVVVTSGTAAAELLPAAMSGHYLGLPLLLVTADRPRRFRKTGSPQTAEQKGLFGCYAHFDLDIALDDIVCMNDWSCQGPAHINICFEEPSEEECRKIKIRENIVVDRIEKKDSIEQENLNFFLDFIKRTSSLLVVIGSLPLSCRESAVRFLSELNAPIYAEATSHLREDVRLEHLRIKGIDKIWQRSAENDYCIDGVLRLGEIPTARLWRDLEESNENIQVCSVSELPFSGLSCAGVLQMPLNYFFEQASCLKYERKNDFKKWQKADRECYDRLSDLFEEEPEAEPSLFHSLSYRLSDRSNIYLGNSLPVREWDLAATYENKSFEVYSSRGVNGIDGQISTFLGLSHSGKDNWAVLGDLTVLYDMVGPWILSQMSHFSINIAVVNNGGGQIFSSMYSMPEFTNPHRLEFEHYAKFWNLRYEKWSRIPGCISSANRHRFIEIMPDPEATRRFWKKAKK